MTRPTRAWCSPRPVRTRRASAAARRCASRDRSRHAGAGDDDDEDRVTDEHGRILRDNAYGTIDDDVWRRDFTANALYYNIADFSIWDYAGGVEDIAARRLQADRRSGHALSRGSGAHAARRALRGEARLHARRRDRHARSAALRELLGSVPPARLFDETLKLFLTGHGAMSLVVLQRHGSAGASCCRRWRAYLDRHPDGAVSRAAATGTGQHRSACAAGKPVTPTLPVRAAAVRADRRDHREAAAGEVARHRHDCRCRGSRGARRAGRISIPKRFSLGVREMFAAQPRLEQPRGAARAAHARAAALPRRLRPAAAARARWAWPRASSPDWWTQVQEVSQTDRDRMADALAPQQRPAGDGGGARRGPRRRRRRVADAHPRPHERRSGRGCVRRHAALAAGLRRRGQQPRRIRARRCGARSQALGRLPRHAR